MNWGTVLQDWIASSPGWALILGAAVVNWRKTRAHVDKVTGQQTEKIAEITDQQTRQLTEGRHQPARPPYHGHGDIHP